jgi:hypothetical protein
MIYTTREINVNGNTATIDEDIYLFKQDSNIELKFIINNTRFTFQTTESTNVVESSNASYFRVKLLNPYGKTINFPIQEVTDNFIVLLITEELIDEDTEVGDYTIQIRLYDKDKNSKLTLPAITNCIHIQQPIFDEVEESTVDTAAIDTASVMESDEGELPVVDSTGKYIPTLWDTGDTISKAKINHIEKGILQAHTDALGAKIPRITPPKGQNTSDIKTIYNMLPENGLVFFTESYGFSDAFIVGLCSVGAYTTEKGDPAKTIVCTSNAMSVDITSTGVILDYGISNFDLDSLMKTLNNERRTKGQVLTMTSDNAYGWADVPNTIPQITPPKQATTSDIVTLYNALPERGLVYFTDSYNISDAYIIGLCYIDPYTDNNKPAKTIICTSTVMYVNITSTGDISGTGIANYDFDKFVTEVLKNPNRKTGQVLTMINDSEYGWADTTPQLYVYSVTGSGAVELTVDPYQIIDVKILADLSSPDMTVNILLPTIDESDTNVYKIHLLLRANLSIEYEFPTANYDRSLNNLTSGVMYEFIYTYVSPFWVCHCIEYSNKISNAPK